MENENLQPDLKEEAAEQELEPKEAETPAEEDAEAPAEEKKDETPAEEKQDETPAEEKQDETPAPINRKKLGLVIVAALAVVAVIVWGGIHFLRGSIVEDKPQDTSAPTETTASADTTAPADTTVPATTPAPTNTMTDEEAAEAMSKVVATMGSAQLTNGELSACYWMAYYEFSSQLYNYGMSPAYFGLDTTLPLSEQPCGISEEEITWEDFFLEQALENWANYQALALAAEELELELSSENQASLDTFETSLAQSASYYGFESPEAMLRADFGAGVTLDDYKTYLRTMMMANEFYAYYSRTIEFTDEEVSAFYDDNPAMFQENGIEKDDAPSAINVRHILIIPEGDKVDGAYTAEQMEAARAAAQDVLDAWTAGEATEDSFAALAGEHSEDPGSASNGGLYEDVTPGQMVVEFNDWCFNPDRQPGDTGLVSTSYGVHVMYFSGVSDDTPYWYATVVNQLMGARINELAEKAAADHPYEVDRTAIVLSEVDIQDAY